MPFTARITQVSQEDNHCVSIGDTLVMADDINVAEVLLQVPIQPCSSTVEPDARTIGDIVDVQYTYRQPRRLYNACSNWQRGFSCWQGEN